MSEKNGYISEWIPGPFGCLMHVYSDAPLDGSGGSDRDSYMDAHPELADSDTVEPCDLWGHSWQCDPDNAYRCVRCGDEQF